MNTGAISKRYAKALLRYVEQTGRGEEVYAQVSAILKDSSSVPAEALEPDLQRLTALLVENGRIEDVRFVLSSFIGLYCEKNGILCAKLTTAVPSQTLPSKVRGLLEERTHLKVELDCEVNPALIGGFSLEVGGMILDASVKRQIERIRREFIITNNRIV